MKMKTAIETTKLPKATHTGELDIAGLKLRCHVLEDGRRILSQRGLFRALGMSEGFGARGALQLQAFFDASSANTLKTKPSSVDTTEDLSVIDFQPKHGGKSALGYDSKILLVICDAILDARKTGRLSERQAQLAEQCEVLLRSFARLGLVALIDEATGYQAKRADDDLQRILARYVAEEFRPWTKTFPDDFFRQLFRLRHWAYPPTANQTTRYVGKLINFIVYSRLPSGVLADLEEKNPTIGPRRKHKHHQFLTETIGNKHLEGHLMAVTAMMRGCRTWDGFVRLLDNSYPVANTQLALLDEQVAAR